MATIDKLFMRVKGLLTDTAPTETIALSDAKQMVRPDVYVPVLPTAADADYTVLLWAPSTPIIVTALAFIPTVAVTESDTDYISITIAKSVQTAYSATTIGTAFTTQATGQVGDLVAGTSKSITVVTTSSANYIAADTGIYLVMAQTGTGPAWGGTVRISYVYQN